MSGSPQVGPSHTSDDDCGEPIYPRRWLHEASSNLKPIIVGVTCGLGIFCVFACILVLGYICRWRTRKMASNTRQKEERSSSWMRQSHSKVFSKSLKSVSMRDLSIATDHFHDSRVVGDGGFGLVYAGVLPDQRRVAIKKLAMDGMQGTREFEAEIETIGKIKHPNLVELLAYCKVGDDRVLVYEFMENGSLSSWLHEREDGPSILDWEKRMKIAKGGARGLSYLHDECNPRIIHRDIKSSNILLTSDFEPKIADFGMARFMSPTVSHVSTDVAGTLGYMAPEYGLSLGATKQADVYSFGVLLLELATGRRPDMAMRNIKGSWTLARWVTYMVQQERELELVDPALRNGYPSEQVYAYFHISCSCVHESPSERPTMKKVLELLSLMEV